MNGVINGKNYNASALPRLSTGEPTYVNRRAHVCVTKKTFRPTGIFPLYAKDLIREQEKN